MKPLLLPQRLAPQILRRHAQRDDEVDDLRTLLLEHAAPAHRGSAALAAFASLLLLALAARAAARIAVALIVAAFATQLAPRFMDLGTPAFVTVGAVVCVIGIGWLVLLGLCLALVLVLAFRVNALRSQIHQTESRIVALKQEKLYLETTVSSFFTKP